MSLVWVPYWWGTPRKLLENCIGFMKVELPGWEMTPEQFRVMYIFDSALPQRLENLYPKAMLNLMWTAQKSWALQERLLLWFWYLLLLTYLELLKTASLCSICVFVSGHSLTWKEASRETAKQHKEDIKPSFPSSLDLFCSFIALGRWSSWLLLSLYEEIYLYVY